MGIKMFDYAEVMKLLKSGRKKAILDYDLRGAHLDYSCYPMSRGSLHLKADKRLACQLAYHLCSLQCDDADYIKMRNSILDFANQFHRVDECGELEERDIGSDSQSDLIEL